MKYEFGAALTIVLLAALANLAFWGGLTYVALHFIEKFW